MSVKNTYAHLKSRLAEQLEKLGLIKNTKGFDIERTKFEFNYKEEIKNLRFQ